MICINTQPLENASIYHKKLLYKYLKEACIYLNIKQPRVRFTEYEIGSRYWLHQKVIEIGSFDILNVHKENINPYVKYKVNDYFPALLWSLFHELGHHLHFIKYPKFTEKYQYNYNHYYSKSEYRQTRLEKIADNIAFILMKKYYPQGLTN